MCAYDFHIQWSMDFDWVSGTFCFQIGKITKNKIKSNKKLFDHSQLRRIVCSLKTCDWNANNQIEKNVNFVIEWVICYLAITKADFFLLRLLFWLIIDTVVITFFVYHCVSIWFGSNISINIRNNIFIQTTRIITAFSIFLLFNKPFEFVCISPFPIINSYRSTPSGNQSNCAPRKWITSRMVIFMETSVDLQFVIIIRRKDTFHLIELHHLATYICQWCIQRMATSQ